MFGHFLRKRFDLGPIWTGENGFASFFVFAKIFDRKVQKSRVRVVNDNADKVFLRISSRKQKILLNRFCLFIWSTGGVFFYEKNIENLVTLSLQRNHWLGHREWLTMYFAIFSKYFKLTYLRYAAICTVCFVPIGFFFIYKTHTKLLY